MVALFDVAAENGGAADLDGAHDAQLPERQSVFCTVLRAVLSKNVGQLESWPG
jgi:hypothetical protein